MDLTVGAPATWYSQGAGGGGGVAIGILQHEVLRSIKGGTGPSPVPAWLYFNRKVGGDASVIGRIPKKRCRQFKRYLIVNTGDRKCSRGKCNVSSKQNNEGAS